jgi:hypothetical protein
MQELRLRLVLTTQAPARPAMLLRLKLKAAWEDQQALDLPLALSVSRHPDHRNNLQAQAMLFLHRRHLRLAQTPLPVSLASNHPAPRPSTRVQAVEHPLLFNLQQARSRPQRQAVNSPPRLARFRRR